MEDRPFAKSTLQVFRAQLILHGKVREVFESSLRLARESGYLKRRSMKVALDTTNILGRGAVKDTYNLLADGIVKLLWALAAVEKSTAKEWAKAQGYKRYLGSSVKGESAIDWSNKRARAALLDSIVADADRLLELSRQAHGELPEDSEERQRIVAAAELLGQLLLQDVERTDDGVGLKDGVSRDRMMSVHDPEMRHGHKSSSRRFDGHKAAIVVDSNSQLITAVEVLPDNAPDNLGALELVEQSEANTGVPVEESMGDAAYGDGDTRQAFADAGRTLIARVPDRPNRSHFPKEDFHIDLEAGTCTCPAGNVARRIVSFGTRTGPTGRTHRLARLVQLGIRQARYFGRVKTKFQLYLAATVANLTLVASKAGLPEDTGGASKVGSALRAGTIHSTVDFIPARLCQIWALALLTSASLPKLISPNRAFRPGF